MNNKNQQQLIAAARRGGMTIAEFCEKAAKIGISIATAAKIARSIPARLIVDEWDINQAISKAYSN